jgi:hypothetical protein
LSAIAANASSPRRGGPASRRAIAWETLDASSLGAEERREVGETWRERMRQEHLAVGAFSLLAYELAEDGADPAVLALVTRAASDEVRHAEVCRRMAVILLGDGAVPARFRGVPRVPMHRGATKSERVLYHAVEMCCLSETLTGVYFAEMVARASHPTARAVVESLLEDEIDHGRAGWAYLASRAGEGRIDGLSAALPRLVARVFAPILDRAARSPDVDDPAKEAFGHLGRSCSARVVRGALADVVLPGFEKLGVDTSATKAFAHEKGWV